MTRPASTDPTPRDLQPCELKLLEADYSSDTVPFGVREEADVVRLVYDLPPESELRRRCVAVTICCATAFALALLAVLLLAPMGVLAEVWWPVVLLISLVGTFGPAFAMLWTYGRCVEQNPLLEWDRGSNRVTRKHGPEILCPHEVFGLVALTAPDTSGELETLAQLQVVFRTPNGFRFVLLATSTRPGEEAFGDALRTFRERSGCPVWFAEQREGLQSERFALRPVSEDMP